MSTFEAVVVAAHAAVLGLLGIYGLHRSVLGWRFLRARGRPAPPRPPAVFPRVTVQLPLYNERYVAERLIEAACALEYPAGRLEIQILDDSDDSTSRVVAAAVARHAAAGADVRHIRRRARTGFKAGALAHGLSIARGELVAVFDADFVPPRDFLLRVVAAFEDERIGMVQTRWGHLNRGSSPLTRVQALMLDGHFWIEHTARAASGCFFNFNGTGGVWRRRCIEDAGGWQADTLTEDLDLSYRAQLAGWRFAYLPQVVVEGEIPLEVTSFKRQQRRWAKGAIQTARKLLGRVLFSDRPARVKVEAFFHLTASLTYPLMALLALLFPPAMAIRHQSGSATTLYAELAVLAVSTLSVCAFYVLTARHAARGSARDLPFLMAVGIGVSLSNAVAVLEALAGRETPFERTPKYGLVDGERRGRWRAYRTGRAWRARLSRRGPSRGGRGARRSGSRGPEPCGLGLAELALGAYLAAWLAYAIHHRIWISTPFLGLFLVGFVYVGARSLWQGGALTSSSGRRATRSRTRPPPPLRRTARS